MSMRETEGVNQEWQKDSTLCNTKLQDGVSSKSAFACDIQIVKIGLSE